jgi:hypothetical protein
MSSFDPFLELRQQIARRTANTCAHHQPFDRACQTPLEAIQWADLIKQCTKDAQWNHLRWLALNDLYFLIVHILEIPNVNTQWHVDYIGEINRNYDNIIDLATRGSGKSVMKTYGKLLQEILKDPDSTHCIFSHTKPIAKDFLFKIKSTFENHEKLRWLFPDVIWENPERDAPKWSLDRGITVKRKNVTRGEATIECSGMVDGQPTGKHYDWIWYDDIQKEQVSEYMIEQIEQSFDTSLGLSAGKPAKWTMTGVFFRGGSIYEQLLERKVGLARIRPAVNKDCTSPIWTDEHCRATMRSLKPGNWACEYLMDPTMKEANEGFQKEWLRYHKGLSAEDLNSCN